MTQTIPSTLPVGSGGLSEAKKPRVTIAVMGQTGTGKTTFVNAASGSNLTIGDDLESCADNVQASEQFELDGRSVILLDAPGFDDSERTDEEVLRLISTFLAEKYNEGEQLAGIIYTHPISDTRMRWSSQLNFRIFRELCGEKAEENIMFITTMWDKDSKAGESREKQLQAKYFKDALDKGAKMSRCERHGDKDLAHEILRRIIKNHPLPLQIQQELIDEKKPLSQTSAGKELNHQLEEQIEKYEKQIRRLEEEKQEAIKAKDEEAKQEIDRALRAEEKKIRNLKSRIKKLNDDKIWWTWAGAAGLAAGAALMIASPVVPRRR